MNFRKQLIQARNKLGLTQQEVADSIGIPKSTYANYEVKDIALTTKTAEKILGSGILDNSNKFVASWRREKLRAEKQANRNRIPNIPNFYERLNELCDENGRIRKGVNDEVLKELQIDLGVRPETNKKEMEK